MSGKDVGENKDKDKSKDKMSLSDRIQSGTVLAAIVTIIVTSCQTRQQITGATEQTDKQLRSTAYAQYLAAQTDYLRAQRGVARWQYNENKRCLRRVAAGEDRPCKRPDDEAKDKAVEMEQADTRRLVALQQVQFIGTAEAVKSVLIYEEALRHRAYARGWRVSQYVAERLLQRQEREQITITDLEEHREGMLRELGCDLSDVWWPTLKVDSSLEPEQCP